METGKERMIRKLSSRKLWAAIALFVSGLLTMLGFKELAVQIAGCIMQFGAVAAYIAGEGFVDAAHKETQPAFMGGDPIGFQIDTSEEEEE